MAANVSPLPALSDMLLAMGAGALCALIYRLMRLIAGGRGAPCALCDILICIFMAIFYKSAVHSVFNYPAIRVFTLAAMFLGYFASLGTLFYPLHALEIKIHRKKRKKHYKKVRRLLQYK